MGNLNIVTNYSESDYMENVIKQASETGAVIVCQSNSVVDEIHSMADKMGFRIKEAISIQWFKLYEKDLISSQTPVMLFKPMNIIQHLIDTSNGNLTTKDSKKEHMDGRFHTVKRK